MTQKTSRGQGLVLFRLSMVLFVIGLASIVAIFLVAALTTTKSELWLYLVAMSTTPLGFALALVFTLRSGRRAR